MKQRYLPIRFRKNSRNHGGVVARASPVPLLGPLPYQSCADCAWPDAVDAAADSLPIRELAELVLPRVAGRS